MRLYVIRAGTLRIDKGAVFTPGIDDGVLIQIPVPVYLIRTDEDENVLVNTHLHPDHCGGNFVFPHAEIVVQREHYQEALAHPEIPNELFHRPELHYRLLDGDEHLFSGVRAIVAPGHARGFQALLVSLSHSGSILSVGDAIDTAEHLERDFWTHCPNPETARESAQRLQQIAAQEEALLLYGHDAAQWQTLRLSPRFYD